MKRKLLTTVLALMLVLTLFPVLAQANEPFSLEAPQKLSAELKYDNNGIPYFELRLDIPSKVREVNSNLVENPDYYQGAYCNGIEIVFDYKYGKYDWNEGPSLYWTTSDPLSEFIDRGGYWEYRPFDSGTFDITDIKSETYSFRAHFYALWGEPEGWIDNELNSGYSNIATIGNPAFYQNASSWAKEELQKAAAEELIPAILKDADLTKPITREEFAELAVLLYEKTSGQVAASVPNNPFIDTTNPQILKAFALGITKGMSATTFAPKVLINREQCATMLYRAIKAIAPNGDYSITGVKDFPDQKYISSWAVEGTKYMSKLGIIKGDTSGNFMPKAITTKQEATGYGMATREAAILMALRTYEALN